MICQMSVQDKWAVTKGAPAYVVYTGDEILPWYIWIIMRIPINQPVQWNVKGSMYGIFAYTYHTNQPKVGKHTSHMDPTGKGFVAVAQLWLFSPGRHPPSTPRNKRLLTDASSLLANCFLDFLQRCGQFTWMLFLRCFLSPKFLQTQVLWNSPFGAFLIIDLCFFSSSSLG